MSEPGLSHTLISFECAPVCFHGYLICPEDHEPEAIERAVSTMIFNTVEKAGYTVVPIVLATALSGDDLARVRRIASQHPEVEKLLAQVTDFHLSMWDARTDTPVNKLLMEMH